MKIANVETFHIVADRDYMAEMGLRPTRALVRDRHTMAGAVGALDRNEGRHLCAYPAQEQTLLVRVTSDTGLVGMG